MLLVNRSNRVLGIVDISMGGVSGTHVDSKAVFSTALKGNASGLILCHNHPSGMLKPSEADIKLTKKLVDGGKLLDIAIHDHLIISEDDYYSFADDGILKKTNLMHQMVRQLATEMTNMFTFKKYQLFNHRRTTH